MRTLAHRFFLALSLVLLSSMPVDARKPLAVPTELTAVKSLTLPGAVELSWRPVQGAAEYAISASRETDANWQSLGTTSESRFQVNELPEGTRYYFRVASRSGSDQSGWSASAVQYSSQTKDFRPGLVVPSDFRVAAKGSPVRKGELALSWSPVAGARSYVVQICDSDRCAAMQTEEGPGTQLSPERYFREIARVEGAEYMARGLTSGQLYLFRVVGIDARGQQGSPSVMQSGRAP
jgi:hypothetical protein